MTAPVITEPAAAEKSEKIAMTAPVITEQQTAGNMQMSFVLPSQYTSLQQLPEPNNPRVQLIQVPESTYAAVQFTGAPGQQELDQRLSQLKQSLAADAEVKVPAEARPLYCRYNPPWTPWFLRTNELLLGVDYTS
jgi:hypothetical protein